MKNAFPDDIDLYNTVFHDHTAFSNGIVPSSIGILEGPHFKEICYKIYVTLEAEVTGLLAGDIDLINIKKEEPHDKREKLPPSEGDGILNYSVNYEQGWVFDLLYRFNRISSTSIGNR